MRTPLPGSKVFPLGSELAALQSAPEIPLQGQSPVKNPSKNGNVQVLGGGLFSFIRTSFGEITLEHKYTMFPIFS